MRAQKKVQDSSHNFLECWQYLCKRKLNWTNISWFEFEGQLTYANHSYPFYRERGIGRSTDTPLNSEAFDDSTQTLKKSGIKSFGPHFHWRRLLFAEGWSLGCSWHKIDHEYVKKTNKIMKAGVYISSFFKPHLKWGHGIAPLIPVIKVREALFWNVLVIHGHWALNK